MKNLVLKTNKLDDLDVKLIGNGGQSRLDIMLDLETGEVWADEFFDHEGNSWARYHGGNIMQVGIARNDILEDDKTGEQDPDGRCWWDIRIFAQNGDPNEDIYIRGDYYNNSYDIAEILYAIKYFYGRSN